MTSLPYRRNRCRRATKKTAPDPRRELEARRLSANRLALDLGVPSGRITDILNGRRAVTADTPLRLGRYFGNGVRFWLDLQSQYGLTVLERKRGEEIAMGCTRPTPAQRHSIPMLGCKTDTETQAAHWLYIG